MIALVIRVDSRRHNLQDLGRDGRLARAKRIRPNLENGDMLNVHSHLVFSNMVLTDQLLNLRGRQDPADIKENVNVGRSRLAFQVESQ